MKIIDLRHPPKGLLEFANEGTYIWFYIHKNICFVVKKKGELLNIRESYVANSTNLYYNGEKVYAQF